MKSKPRFIQLLFVFLIIIGISLFIDCQRMQAVQNSVPNRLVITRIGYNKAPFTKSVTNPTYVSNLYNTISKLHPIPTLIPLPTGKISTDEQINNLKQHPTCPFSTEVAYRLSFYQGENLISTNIWKPWGVCTTISKSSGNTTEQLDGSSVNQIIIQDITHLFNINSATINCINHDQSTNSLSC